MGTIVTVIALLLYSGGEIIEHVGPHDISSCLKQKREIERYGWKDSANTRYACESKEVEIDINSNGEEFIVRIVE